MSKSRLGWCCGLLWQHYPHVRDAWCAVGELLDLGSDIGVGDEVVNALLDGQGPVKVSAFHAWALDISLGAIHAGRLVTWAQELALAALVAISWVHDTGVVGALVFERGAYTHTGCKRKGRE